MAGEQNPDRGGVPAGQPGERPGKQPDGAGGTGSSPEAGAILADLARLRRSTRRARHAYWFPLLLFGLLTLASAPLYVRASRLAILGHAPTRGAVGSGLVPADVVHSGLSGPFLLGGRPVGSGVYLEWYWAFVLIGGFLLTWLWYRHHARKAGVQTPVRATVVTGIVLAVLVTALPPLTTHVLPWLAIGDLWIRGTIAFLVIAAWLWTLAWAERSHALALIALVYTATALLAALYNVANIGFRLSLPLLATLPNVLLPAAVLVAGGLGGFLAQRLRTTS